jgi:hypothetical protein
VTITVGERATVAEFPHPQSMISQFGANRRRGMIAETDLPPRTAPLFWLETVTLERPGYDAVDGSHHQHRHVPKCGCCMGRECLLMPGLLLGVLVLGRVEKHV